MTTSEAPTTSQEPTTSASVKQQTPTTSSSTVSDATTSIAPTPDATTSSQPQSTPAPTTTHAVRGGSTSTAAETSARGMTSAVVGPTTTPSATTAVSVTRTPSPTVFIDFIATLGMTAGEFTPMQQNFLTAVTDALVIGLSKGSVTDILDASQRRAGSPIVAVTSRLETTEQDAARVRRLLTVDNLNRFLAAYGLSVLGIQIAGEGGGCPMGLMTVADPTNSSAVLCVPCDRSLCAIGELLQCSMDAFTCAPCMAVTEHANFTTEGTCDWECGAGFAASEDSGCLDEDWKDTVPFSPRTNATRACAGFYSQLFCSVLPVQPYLLRNPPLFLLRALSAPPSQHSIFPVQFPHSRYILASLQDDAFGATSATVVATAVTVAPSLQSPAYDISLTSPAS
eukprot:1780137-Rhodomonas_salina.1